MNIIDELVLPYFHGMGIAEYLIDPTVTEIMIGDGLVFVEQHGEMIEIAEAHVTVEALKSAIEVIVNALGHTINETTHPIVDSRLPDGSRIAATYPPVSAQPGLTIRKFGALRTTDDLLALGAITPKSFQVILDGVNNRENVLMAGGTSTGKTTDTNAFILHIPEKDRLLVIESPREIRLRHRNVVRWESYPALGARPGVSTGQLLAAALRHRPDRIIVGEVREPDAAYGLLQAMNTGHNGTIATIHSNTAETALTRLASLAMPGFGSLDLARQEVAAAINLVVEVKRGARGWRGVNRVLRVVAYDAVTREFEMNEVYSRKEEVEKTSMSAAAA